MPSPVAYWKLDEASGTTAYDSSYTGKTGTVIGTANWVAGMHDNGFQFNGATKIQATGLMGSPQNVSVAAWANLTQTDHKGSEIISLGDHFGLRLDDSVNGSSEFSGAFLYDGTDVIYVAVEQTFAGTGWHFFAATFDDTNNLFELYIDGELAASETVTSSISYASRGSNTVVGRHGNGSTNYDFKGVIDDAAVYNYALSAAQVAELYESGPTTQFQFDCNGNLVKTTDPLGNVTEYEYDSLNRLITRTDADPDGAGTTYESPVTQYTYNSLGWLTSMTDPEGNVTFYKYDAMGRQKKEVKVVEPGLRGEYREYSGGTLLHTRVDEDIDFDSDADFAGYDDLPGGFSATWTGAIYIADPGDVTFYLNNTDYSELYIDDFTNPVVVNSSTGDMQEAASAALR